MPTASIELVEIGPGEKQEFWQIMQEYLRELETLAGSEILPGQTFEYPYWERYWDGSPGYYKFWILIGPGKVGFILLREMTAEEWPDTPPPTQIAEFCILRPFRSREIGSSVLRFLLDDFRRRREVLTWDCLKVNIRAEKMYDLVIANYRTEAGEEWTCRKAEFQAETGPMHRYVCVPQ